jgi:hypothetical protein
MFYSYFQLQKILKIIVFWAVKLCSLANGYQCLEKICCLCLQGEERGQR